MVDQADWMKKADTAFLQLLLESGLELTPSNIAHNMGYSNGYTRKRCKELTNRTLLVVSEEGTQPFYSISKQGEQILLAN